MDRVYLSAEELETVQEILDRFVDLPLTDVWGRWEEMRFEFGEQKHFIDRGGDDLKRAGSYIESEKRFKIWGLGECVLDETTFYGEGDTLTPLSKEFVEGAEAGRWCLESGAVFPDGRILLKLSEGISIELLAFTEDDLVLAEDQIVNCWWIGWEGEVWSLYTDNLYYGEKNNSTSDLEVSDLTGVREALEAVRGLALTGIEAEDKETLVQFGSKATFRSSIPIHLVWGACRQPLRRYPKSDDVNTLVDAMAIDSLQESGKYRKGENIVGVFDLWVTKGKLVVADIRMDSRGCFALDLRNPEKDMGDYVLVLSHGYFLDWWGWEMESGDRVWRFDGKRILMNP